MRTTLRAIWRIPTAPFRWVAARVRNTSDFFKNEPEDTPLPDVVANAVSNVDELFYHLDELRKHLLRAVLAMVVTTGVGFFFAGRIIALLSERAGPGVKLQAIEVTESIGTFMKVSLLVGFALALPYIVFELWLFVAPGLKTKERLFALAGIPAATLLFLAGAGFAYFVMLPTALPFLMNFLPGVVTIPRLSSYVSFVTSLLFWVGIAFEFPLVIYVLAGLGFVKARVLAQQWRIAVVVISIVAAAITPTVDPVNMSLVMGPMILLYFFSIVLAFIAQKGRGEKV